MKYISIGVVMAPSTEHILKVSHYGTEFTLTGDLARLWLDGRYGFANSETPIEHKALSQLKRMRLVITTNPYKVGEYRALTQCMIVPTEKKGPDFSLNAEEKNILVWLREAGLRLTMAELIYLRERKIPPTLDLLGTENRQRLVERIYNIDNIFDNLLEDQMELSKLRKETVSLILELLRKKKIVLL